LPFKYLTVKVGLSSKIVLVPTIMAISSLRHLWTKVLAVCDVILVEGILELILVLSINPSAD
jgi:hypothetical protein